MIRFKRQLILALAVINFTMISNLYPEVKHRILNDGTVEYFTTEKNVYEYKAAEKKVEFKSAYLDLIEKYAKLNDLDPYLIKCLIKIESNFDPSAVSEAGAMGLMQIMQDVGRFYSVRDPLDPEENLRAGTTHFKSLMDYFQNDVPLALAAYHAGLGRVKKKMKIPPIKSTIEYVNAIMALYIGKKDDSVDLKIAKLYKRIDKDGAIVLFNKTGNARIQ